MARIVAREQQIQLVLHFEKYSQRHANKNINEKSYYSEQSAHGVVLERTFIRARVACRINKRALRAAYSCVNAVRWWDARFCYHEQRKRHKYDFRIWFPSRDWLKV